MQVEEQALEIRQPPSLDEPSLKKILLKDRTSLKGDSVRASLCKENERQQTLGTNFRIFPSNYTCIRADLR